LLVDFGLAGRGSDDDVTRPFSLAYKQKMLDRLTGKDAISARQRSLETGLRQQTLSRWLQDACSLSVMPSKRQRKEWSIDDKIRILAQAGRLTGAELTDLLKREGLLLAEYEQWRLALADEGRASLATTKRIRALERELARKEKALAEAAALLVLKKKSEPPVGGRGRRYGRGERAVILAALGEAQTTGARLHAACGVIGIAARTIERWRGQPGAGDRRCGPRRRPRNALTSAEEAHLLAVMTSARYGNVPPKQLVPRLADEGMYLASESTMYRLQKRMGLGAHRRPVLRTHVTRRATVHRATRPNQLWSWDITYLPTAIRGRFLRLYLVMDVWSRRIVGWDARARDRHACGGADSAYLRGQRHRPDRAGAALGQRQADARQYDARHVAVAWHRPLLQPTVRV
jgi:transposase InsO family protein